MSSLGDRFSRYDLLLTGWFHKLSWVWDIGCVLNDEGRDRSFTACRSITRRASAFAAITRSGSKEDGSNR